MIKVRKASLQDKDQIVAFQISMAMETENLILYPEIVNLGVEAVFRDPAKGTYYVAVHDNRVIASLLTTYEWSDWRNGDILWIQSVFVEGEFRGRGVFRMLYDYVKSIVMDDKNNYRGIRLYVDKSNAKAIEVYRKLGMTNHHYETFEWMKP
jgi:ribosomal protein S18 acetylase RimI-like enzyme